MTNLLQKQKNEQEFSHLYFTFIRGFNGIESNLNSFLNINIMDGEIEITLKKCATLSFNDKLDIVFNHITSKDNFLKGKFIKKVNLRHEEINYLRKLRNDIIHGFWDVTADKDKPIIFHKTEWEPKYRLIKKQYSFKEFEDLVKTCNSTWSLIYEIVIGFYDARMKYQIKNQ